MNRHLQRDCGLSLGDYTVLNALDNAPERTRSCRVSRP